MARKFSREFKNRAVRFAYDHQEVHACSRLSAAQAIDLKLGVSLHSILEWMTKDAASTKAGEGSGIDYAAANARLRAEILGLCWVNELPKEASAFSRLNSYPR